MKSFVYPQTHDILAGRSKAAFLHPGNENLRSFVAKFLDNYLTAKTRCGKTKIIRDVHKKILDKGGRFLKYDSDVKRWYLTGHDEAKLKVSRAFRDASVPNKVKCVEAMANARFQSLRPQSFLDDFNTRMTLPTTLRNKTLTRTVSERSAMDDEGDHEHHENTPPPLSPVSWSNDDFAPIFWPASSSSAKFVDPFHDGDMAKAKSQTPRPQPLDDVITMIPLPTTFRNKTLTRTVSKRSVMDDEGDHEHHENTPPPLSPVSWSDDDFAPIFWPTPSPSAKFVDPFHDADMVQLISNDSCSSSIVLGSANQRCEVLANYGDLLREAIGNFD
eukprot:CAMPEP_0119004580 /NCGR_PEP_ID=MMETSP1176-20130426/1227_1 /TAXON_ID=265551 /ORGANISM="Synedropsis recta cf, Strain CCMP1620" /LENGTH=329 /DNA_ID=CAMNT_0006956303 /DNA_START=42 /DNA_END=1031 /DNA_ORIENTATION=+